MKTFLLLLCLFPLSAFAQSNDFSVFLGGVKFDTTTIAAFAPEDFEAELAFENAGAFTVSFNHFWRENFSTELALIGMGADPTLNVESGPVDISVDLGKAGIGAFTGAAQWHFRRASRVSPYVGAGLALISGEIEAEGEDDLGNEINETVDLEGAGTLMLNGGVNIRMTDRWVFAIDAKVIPYTAEIEDEEALPEEESIDEIDLNPFILSFGVRFRF